MTVKATQKTQMVLLIFKILQKYSFSGEPPTLPAHFKENAAVIRPMSLSLLGIRNRNVSYVATPCWKQQQPQLIA